MSGPVVVKPVVTKKEWNDFVLFPYTLYRKILKNPYWAPPLRIDEKNKMNRKKYPFYEHAEMQEFLAYRDGQIVGRIAGIIDFLHHKHLEPGVGYYGFFETINDKDVAFALFDAATDWNRKKGMKRIIGPISPTTNQILGTQLNDFDGVPMVQDPYNPDYYPALTDAYGFGKEKDHLAFIIRREELQLSDKIRRVVNLVRKNPRITFRTFKLKDFKTEKLIAKDLYNQAFKDNSDFIPFTDPEFEYLANDLKLAILEELSFFAFVDGKPAGLVISLHNFNDIFVKMNGRLLPFGIFRLLFGKKKLKTFRLSHMGVLEQHRRMGIDALMVLEAFDRGTAMGYQACEVSLILEDNHMLVNMLNKWGAPVYRTYRVYEKTL